MNATSAALPQRRVAADVFVAGNPAPGRAPVVAALAGAAVLVLRAARRLRPAAGPVGLVVGAFAAAGVCVAGLAGGHATGRDDRDVHGAASLTAAAGATRRAAHGRGEPTLGQRHRGRVAAVLRLLRDLGIAGRPACGFPPRLPARNAGRTGQCDPRHPVAARTVDRVAGGLGGAQAVPPAVAQERQCAVVAAGDGLRCLLGVRRRRGDRQAGRTRQGLVARARRLCRDRAVVGEPVRALPPAARDQARAGAGVGLRHHRGRRNRAAAGLAGDHRDRLRPRPAQAATHRCRRCLVAQGRRALPGDAGAGAPFRRQDQPGLDQQGRAAGEQPAPGVARRVAGVAGPVRVLPVAAVHRCLGVPHRDARGRSARTGMVGRDRATGRAAVQHAAVAAAGAVHRAGQDRVAGGDLRLRHGAVAAQAAPAASTAG